MSPGPEITEEPGPFPQATLVSARELMLATLLLFGVWLTTQYSYLLFHSLVELFSIVVALTFSSVALASHRTGRNPYLVFIGIGYLFVGVLDTLHMLSFRGMNIFTDYDYYAPQFWIAARFLEAASMFLGAILVAWQPRLRMPWVFCGFAVSTAGVIASILVFKVFPACFVAGHGLTPFKIQSEYVICLLLLANVAVLQFQRDLLGKRGFRLVQCALLLMVAMELCFTRIVADSMADLAAIAGHLAKVGSFALIFKAVVITAIRDPIDLLFRDLMTSNAALREAKESAEQGFLNEKLLMGAIVASSEDAILTFDSAGRVTNWNEGARRLLGYRLEEISGRSILTLVPDSSRERWNDWLQQIAEGRPVGNQDSVLARSDQATVDVSVSLSPLPAHDGRLLGGSLIARDTTVQRAAERATARDRQRLKTILRTSSDGIHILDSEGRLIEANDAFLRMLGYDASVVGTLRVTDWDAASEWPEIQARNDHLIASRGSHVFETIHRHRDGHLIEVEISAAGIEIEGSGYLYAASRDITQRKQLEVAQKIAAVAFETRLGMLVTDADGIILRANRAYSDITGYGSEEVVGSKYPLLREDAGDAGARAAIRESLQRHGSWQGEVQDCRRNGDAFPQWVTFTAVRDSQGKVSHYVISITDITEKKTAEQEIRSLAFYDPLTLLPNRRLLMDRLRQAAAGGMRSHGHIALLFIDLDNFKVLNDTAGHSKGDLLLRQVATIISGRVREGDTVARLGGDEFVVILTELAHDSLEAANEARRVAEKILAAVSRSYELDSFTHHMSASIGITLLDRQGEELEEPLKRADLAMYEAKGAGRNTIRFFDPQMQTVVTARAALESELRAAVNLQQFELHFQPQVTTSGRVTGAEALIRWRHPVRGTLAPAAFIDVAEVTGLIVPMGRWVIEAACRQLAEWSHHPLVCGLPVAVNVSARQFRHPEFVTEILQILRATGADPRLLKLELTESAVLDDVETAIGKMQALRRTGIGIALDDFGVGQSSLSILKRLPLDQLKIDQSFVRDILTDPNDAAIARMIVALADELGLLTIAEGVETQAQRDFLIARGCDVFQGYLFCRPVPAAEFLANLRTSALGAVIG